MFKGMPCMVKVNIGTELGISNGSTGVIYDILLHPKEIVDYSTKDPHYLLYHPVAVYIKLDTKKDNNGVPEVKFTLPNLPPNVFLMTTSFNTKGNHKVDVHHSPAHLSQKIRMSRRQFRFLPAYAITVNASQGRTLSSALIHLDGVFKNNIKPYVMLSRLTNGDNMGIIGKWEPSLWTTKPCPGKWCVHVCV